MSGTSGVFGAVDLGASGGRVMAGVVTGSQIALEPVYRFDNKMTLVDAHVRWNLSELFAEVVTGLRQLARRHPDVVSIGIDTWAVDYALLDERGELLAEPIAYRDSRTDGVHAAVHRIVSRQRLYEINGLQFLPFNTIYQLEAERNSAVWPRARHAVLLPDLLAYWLTGQLRTEMTNASTTGLLDVAARTMSAELGKLLKLPPDLFPPLTEPGEVIGTITAGMSRLTGLPEQTTVVAVGSHDTASAVVGVPAASRSFAFVSSGTWSLVGVELDQPVLSDEARLANFTNEGGVDRRIRFLRNVGGLWLLQESLRTWREAGVRHDPSVLHAQAADLDRGGPTIDVDDPQFIPPGDMPERIRQKCHLAGRSAPQTPAVIVRCILDSLAVAYATTLRQAQQLSDKEVDVIHIVGGGSQNELLCQLTADLAGLDVLSGPVEATALGNIMVQARTQGSLNGDLDQLRARLRTQLDLRRYQPQ